MTFFNIRLKIKNNKSKSKNKMINEMLNYFK